VLGHWNELTPAQQQAFRAYFPEPTPAVASTRTASAALIAAEQTASLQQELELLRDQLRPKIAAELGRDLPVPIAIILLNKAYKEASAMTIGVTAKGGYSGLMAACRIYVFPIGQALTGAERSSFLSHELFHCFQFSLGTLEAIYNPSLPPWVLEGEAAWVGETIAGGSARSTTWWMHWLTKPQKTLFERSYDAIGFYGHLQHQGNDVWAMLDPLLESADGGGAAGAYTWLDDATSDGILDSWGSAYHRISGVAPWEFTGPGITGEQASFETITLTAPQSDAIVRPVPVRVAVPLHLELMADVVVIDAGGIHGRVRTGDGIDRTLADVSGQPLCTIPAECACPDDSAGADVGFTIVPPGRTELGAWGHLVGGTITLTAYSLDDFCQLTQVGIMDPCLVGTWVSAPWTMTGLQQVTGGSSLPDSLKGGAGVRLTFTADAREILDFSQMTNLIGRIEETDTTLRVSFEGVLELDVSADGGMLDFLGLRGSAVLMSATAQLIGETFKVLDRVPLHALATGPVLSEGSVEYTCSATSIHLPLSSRAEPVVWTRVP
jgi:hypothetical protein